MLGQLITIVLPVRPINNNICPTGFRVPTIQEFKDEKIGANSIVFENFLGLPMSGKRISP
jgi:hypothetical protein